MARVNITVPDELVKAAKAQRLNISECCRTALAAELERRAQLHDLDGYLTELERDLGPVSTEDREAAKRWADRVFGPAPQSRSRTA